ncbi:hypothetical protein BCR44DRAFT_1119196 [Catenaria anguillulae PL171]|uniref:Ankyrin repeat-containing domain protein n=1 Tax=Catenaria anguillulae PL171 TaxID=765915 RepID=A0A1Y2HLB3_9FUNG|nr:hypothetical protein BCR44DRAFT_1119196 [Catenaria anguillulae PL171]
MNHMNPLPPASASLPLELADPILACIVHLVAVSSRWNPAAIAHPLNTIARSLAPLATEAALMHLPHIDLDTATKVGNVELLRFMHKWSRQPGGRPINYKSTLDVAMEVGHVEVLDWWMDESQLLLNWHAPSLELTCRQGHVCVLEWWQGRGFPHLDKVSIQACIREASVAGHMHVLEWLLVHLPGGEFAAGARVIEHMVLEHVAQEGHVGVLEWWYSKAGMGLVEMLPLGKVVLGGMKGAHVQVLEWCEQYPESIKQANGLLVNNQMHVLMHAVNGKLLDWIDRLGIIISNLEYWHASEAACRNGDLFAIQWLHRKGFLVGSRSQLLSLAVGAVTGDDLGVLEWIQAMWT